MNTQPAPSKRLASSLSAAVDFIAEMQERGLDVDRITRSLSFSFAIGPEFFVQIAKLRAFRMVWAESRRELWRDA